MNMNISDTLNSAFQVKVLNFGGSISKGFFKNRVWSNLAVV